MKTLAFATIVALSMAAAAAPAAAQQYGNGPGWNPWWGQQGWGGNGPAPDRDRAGDPAKAPNMGKVGDRARAVAPAR